MNSFFQFKSCILFLLGISTIGIAQEKIDRKAVVTRHDVKITAIDTLASLSVGNGKFAYTVDATGLQTFPEKYQRGIPLGTQAEWGWDAYKNVNFYKFSETLKDVDQYGRKISYSTQIKEPARKKEAVEWFRQNPHLLQLGNIGFEITKKDGSLVQPEDIKAINQKLNLWTGKIESYFEVEGTSVKVITACDQTEDALGFKVESDLIQQGRLKIRVRIPFPTGVWGDMGTKWEENQDVNISAVAIAGTDMGKKWEGKQDYKSNLKIKNKSEATITHLMDSISYDINLKWKGTASIKEKAKHYFLVEPSNSTTIELSCSFIQTEKNKAAAPSFEVIEKSSIVGWESFWKSGAAIDFAGSTDKRANELERRVVLSQYLTKIQCAGSMPPQETGLTYNSWYGKPHLEMHWWHGVHFPLWNRPEYLEKTLGWYENAFDKAKKIAQRQGFEGARWQKMTDPDGNESPSSVGAFLIWQQPHFITYAELLYQSSESENTLKKYSERVFATADFMASFAFYDKEKKRYILGPGVIPAQERFVAAQTFNPTYELAYWNWGLKTAIAWKKRMKQAIPEKWEAVLKDLSLLPVQNNVYLAAESAQDSYTNPEFKTDHPSVLGTFGMLPETAALDKKIMRNTFDLVWDTWSWQKTWGWDFPMVAMSAARLQMPEKAIDALFMDVVTNTYLKNGHNYQSNRLTLYLPGNGGLLTTVAMMCGGWEGTIEANPGFPKDGTWKVKSEGFQKMF
jgi:protein-glucosylgalactosylhydroxylysine glucosidase